MMDGRVIDVPVVKKKVDTPYYIGEVEVVAMKAPIYDIYDFTHSLTKACHEDVETARATMVDLQRERWRST